MDFWNDIEGKSIAGIFPLTRLIRREGRGGLFATRLGDEAPAVILVAEKPGDHAAVLEQWRIAVRLRHPNLVATESYGESRLDETPLLYAVMEAPDEDLAEILAERPMTVAETLQIASSLVAALRELRANGLVHGHLIPGNIFAVGEAVKLRQDGARKIPFDAPEETRNRLETADIRDLGLLIVEALTQRREWPTANQPLPPPFDRIVPRLIDGSWGLEDAAKFLNAEGRLFGHGPSGARDSVIAAEGDETQVSGDAFSGTARRAAAENGESLQLWTRESGAMLAAAMVLLLLIAGWYAYHPLTPEQRAIAESKPAAMAIHDPPDAQPGSGQDASASDGATWRVVAFSYPQEALARRRARELRRRYSRLEPQVFNAGPNGPFLVVLGGGMTRGQALAMQERARNAGFSEQLSVQDVRPG